MTIEVRRGGITLLDILEQECQNSTDFPAFVLYSGPSSNSSSAYSLSFTDVWKCVEDHQAWLTKNIDALQRSYSGIQDIAVAYLSSNSIDMFLSVLSCTSQNNRGTRPIIPALLNTRWSVHEMARALQSKHPSEAGTLILYGDGFETTAEQVCKELGHSSISVRLPSLVNSHLKVMTRMIQSGTLTSRVSKRLKIHDLERRGSTDDAMIVFTSGTTGGSKGVLLSHRAIAVQSIAKQMEPCNYSCTTTMLASTVPLFHIGGISSFLSVLLAGGSLVFPDVEVRFDPQTTIIALSHQVMSINTLVVVPAMLTALLEVLEPSTVYPHVELLLIGGQSAPKPMLDQLQRIFSKANIVQTFACTEAASSLTFHHVNGSTKKSQKPDFFGSERSNNVNGDCVGSPPAHVLLRLYRNNGSVTKVASLPYQPGVIATRGPHVMNGYWDRGAPSRVKRVTGWYLTSDLGFFDDKGQLYFCGRVNDTIRSGGETIMAQEVERVLLKNPKILECAVFARPDERFGEAVACAIVSKSSLELGAIKTWCEKENLASYKRPRHLFLVDSLPRNSSGKVLKHQLVQRFGRRQSNL